MHYYHWNPIAGVIDTRALENVDVLIHLAGATILRYWTPHYRRVLYASRVYTMQWLYHLWRHFPFPKRVISISGLGCYDDHGDEWITEDTPCASPETNTLAWITHGWEQATRQWAERNIPYTILRAGIVLAPTGGAFPLMATLTRWRLLSVIGRPDAWFSWVHIQDLCEAFAQAIEGRLEGTYNVVSPQPEQQADFVQAFYDVLGSQPLIRQVPLWLAQLGMGEVVKYMTYSLRVRPEGLTQQGFTFQFPELRQALTQLATTAYQLRL